MQSTPVLSFFVYIKEVIVNIRVYNQASIKITGSKTIYFDSYLLEEENHDADIIFITHDHYDHYDEDSIRKAMNNKTILVVPTILKDKATKLTNNILVVEPNNTYTIDNIVIDAIPSYNTDAPYHPKEKDYVGYNVTMDDTKYYIMGDTSRTVATDQVKTDICFVPIGGIYTMNVEEAIDYINYLKPKKAIPIHYGSIVGDISLGETFKKNINKEIEVEILI